MTSEIGNAQGVFSLWIKVKEIDLFPRSVPLANFFETTLKVAALRGATFGSFTTPES